MTLRGIIRRGLIVFLLCLIASAAHAGEVREGVLYVEGKPFYPLGSWNFAYTTPQDIARLGMNVSFVGGPGTEDGVEAFRPFMRDCDALGIQVVPYLSYGGAGITPWAPDAVRAIAKLDSEPNLLAWYVGDDIGMPHLPGIQQTVDILREHTPTVPTAADYIAKETPEAKTTFTKYIDIRCQYAYPVPDDPLASYLEFFDQQREFVGDPLWTWVQCFMWQRTGRMLGAGAEGPGPIPEPEQIRLLSFAAINRGVRGLLFFPHHELHRLAESAAEVALMCREIRLFSNHLAAGTTTFNLTTSDPDINASAFRFGDSTVVSAALFKAFYHRWVDEAIVENVTIECPWPGDELPTALLVSTPDIVDCTVEPAATPGTVSITLPSLEVAGFVLLSNDASELTALRTGVAAIPQKLATLVVPAAATQSRKVATMIWQLGLDNLYAPDLVMKPMRAVERCSDAIASDDWDGAVRAWRETLRASRSEIAETMRFAEARRDRVPERLRLFLDHPYSLHRIPGLATAPDANDPWHFAADWRIAGPFPLEWDGKEGPNPPPGFDRAYPPEVDSGSNVTFETMDGPAGWLMAESDLAGLLDFTSYFETTENAVCYARCIITAPRDMDVRMSLGSNDGARVWVNGEDVFAWSSVSRGGRSASSHQDEFNVALKEGKNVVLGKVENLGMDWQLYLSIFDPDRALSFSRN